MLMSLGRRCGSVAIAYASPKGAFGLTKLRVSGVVVPGTDLHGRFRRRMATTKCDRINTPKVFTLVTTCARNRR